MKDLLIRNKRVWHQPIWIILIVALINFYFGFYHLGQAALTDEHYWVYERTPKFWKNIAERDWNGTRRSDKPGVTLMILSGSSLLKINNPASYKRTSQNRVSSAQLEKLNFTFRLPILLVSLFSLLLLYFLLKKLLGETGALWPFLFLGLSPILIGISRLVNPDALLWLFSTLAILSFWLLLKDNRKRWAVAAGIWLGMALLTKYVANILFIFFLEAIFLEAILAEKKMREKNVSGNLVFRDNVFKYFGVTVLALLTFTLLYPAVWARPSRLIKATLFSQAFVSVWPFFVGVLSVILLDALFFKSKMIFKGLDFLHKQRKRFVQALCSLFLLLMGIIVANTYLNKAWIDFEKILASPKSATGAVAIYLSDFYPIIFGVSSLALVAIIFWLVKGMKGKLKTNSTKTKIGIIILMFILTYYLGSAVSEVASIIRYQIILFPLVLILGGIAWAEGIEHFQIEGKRKALALVFVVASLSFSLFLVRPFYLAYASFLLPKQYYLDLKDMGYGSYEAAQFLNSLPDAYHKRIWSDKNGVCEFFVGECASSLDFKKMYPRQFDYYVVSSGRAAKVKRAAYLRIRDASPFAIRYGLLYNTEKAFWEIKLAGRPNNFVKIIEAKAVKIK